MRFLVSLSIAVLAFPACKCEQSGARLYELAQEADAPGSRARAFELYLGACDKGVAEACNDASVMLSQGEEMSVDEPRALDLLERACRGGDFLSCANLAGKHHAANDAEKAARAAERACEGNAGRGCTLLAMLASDGAAGLSMERELPLLEKAVALGEPLAKTLLATNLIKAGKDLSRADTLLSQSCEEVAMGCVLLGHLHDGVDARLPKDAARARAAYEKACATEVFECNELANFLGPKEQARARELYSRACDAGNGTACLNLGSRFEKGEGVERNLTHARDLYRRACDTDEPEGCVALESLSHSQP
ncbi:MAG: tetratricopeptide repeat protein [Archangium sp.]|nr:tetratricopeptide repeat protein [Archangium sp.]